MYRILIIPANSSAPVGLFFHTRDSAIVAQKNIHDMQKGDAKSAVLTAKDDVGHVLTMSVGNISYALFIDMDQTLERPAEAPAKSLHTHMGNGTAKPEIIV